MHVWGAVHINYDFHCRVIQLGSSARTPLMSGSVRVFSLALVRWHREDSSNIVGWEDLAARIQRGGGCWSL